MLARGLRQSLRTLLKKTMNEPRIAESQGTPVLLCQPVARINHTEDDGAVQPRVEVWNACDDLRCCAQRVAISQASRPGQDRAGQQPGGGTSDFVILEEIVLCNRQSRQNTTKPKYSKQRARSAAVATVNKDSKQPQDDKRRRQPKAIKMIDSSSDDDDDLYSGYGLNFRKSVSANARPTAPSLSKSRTLRDGEDRSEAIKTSRAVGQDGDNVVRNSRIGLWKSPNESSSEGENKREKESALVMVPGTTNGDRRNPPSRNAKRNVILSDESNDDEFAPTSTRNNANFSNKSDAPGPSWYDTSDDDDYNSNNNDNSSSSSDRSSHCMGNEQSTKTTRDVKGPRRNATRVNALEERSANIRPAARSSFSKYSAIDDELSNLADKALRISDSGSDSAYDSSDSNGSNNSSSSGISFDSHDISIPGDKENADKPASKSLPAKPVPDAPKMSRTTFLRRRKELTTASFAEFNKKAFAGRLSEVAITWSPKLRTTAGLTRLRRKVYNMSPDAPEERSASIELSTKVLDDLERLRATLLHEMVHAAAWIIDAVSKPPHGACFKKWAKVAMKAIPDIQVTTTHGYEIQFKYAWACTQDACNFVVKRHSRSVDIHKHLCGKCLSKLVEVDPKSLVSATRNGIADPPVPKKKRAPSAYNLFIKENSQAVRTRLLQSKQKQNSQPCRVTQAEVMKECGRLWRMHKEKQ